LSILPLAEGAANFGSRSPSFRPMGLVEIVFTLTNTITARKTTPTTTA
jgi:hypothetical protein